MPSTLDLSQLPSINQLRRLSQSLAMLDAILSPDWQYRYYSFNADWASDQALASMRNGSGDHYFLFFTPAGAIMKGFVHEAAMSPDAHDPPQVWPGVLDAVPASFADFLTEPAFMLDDTTFCIWRRLSDTTWQRGLIQYPAAPDPDGSARLLAILDDNPQTYQAYAEEYYERPVSIQAITYLYAYQPLAPEIIAELNDELTLEDVQEDLDEIQYPSSSLDNPTLAPPDAAMQHLFWSTGGLHMRFLRFSLLFLAIIANLPASRVFANSPPCATDYLVESSNQAFVLVMLTTEALGSVCREAGNYGQIADIRKHYSQSGLYRRQDNQLLWSISGYTHYAAIADDGLHFALWGYGWTDQPTPQIAVLAFGQAGHIYQVYTPSDVFYIPRELRFITLGPEAADWDTEWLAPATLVVRTGEGYQYVFDITSGRMIGSPLITPHIPRTGLLLIVALIVLLPRLKRFLRERKDP